MKYGEGVFLGYRWYTSYPDKAQPLFAFGYGLSYTSVKRHDWQVDPGKFEVYVGNASDHTPLVADLALGK